MKNRVITISRESGTSGRTIGHELSKRLGIPCYDQEIINQIAEKTGFSKEIVKDASEYMEHTSWFAGSFNSSSRGGQSVQGNVWSMQKKIVQQIAHEGPCIIIGRCADFILEDQEDLLRVFIMADIDKRIEYIEKKYGKIEGNPKKAVQDKDSHRAAYYKYFTQRTWGDPANYDLVLNSGTLGADKCIDVLEKLF